MMQNVSIAFTSEGYDFEFAIVVSIALFGLSSDQEFAGVIRPLVEVPVLTNKRSKKVSTLTY